MSEINGFSPEEILAAAEERGRRHTGELALTRERAANWSKGIGALLVAALAFSLIKGRDDLTSLDPSWARAVGGSLGIAAGLATAAAYKLFRASYGSLKPLGDNVSDHTEAAATMTALKGGLGLSVGAFLMLLVAVGATWYGPDADPPRLRVTDGQGNEVCGAPERTDEGELILEVAGQQTEVDLTTITRIEAVADCS